MSRASEAERLVRPLIIIIWPLMLVSLYFIFYWFVKVDYLSSYYGYLLLPTKKIHEEEVARAFALLLMAMQILSIYVWFSGNSKLGKGLMWGVIYTLAWGADTFTDVYFKSSANRTLFTIIIAFFETNMLYTVGSEFLFTIVIATIINTADDFVLQIFATLKGIGRILGVIAGNDTVDSATHRGSGYNR